MKNLTTSRFKFALKSAGWHLLISLLLAGAAALLVFKLWYPHPYEELTGGLALYQLVVVVDVICGPLLTLVLASPKKSAKERVVDFSLIGTIQLAALLYGLYSVSLARPVVAAFEQDRIMVVTAAEVDHAQLANAPEGLQQLSWFGVKRAGLREPANTEEANQRLNLSLQGVEPSMRPNWWLEDDEKERAKIRAKMKPLSVLAQARGLSEAQILAAAAVKPDEQLHYLPFTSSLNKGWIVLLNQNADFVAYAPIDGFISNQQTEGN
ncbi:fimb protein [Neisseria iguanae]|uniref:Fimb protein n=1 Tax=Neisseria iguanae TaxID=90242 RepID=A0A2P7U2Q8_9NEIS|nr:fimb protein [Neisseria iguanae]PSJ81221.1 fimb protein [Neisseria iguanae]